MHVKTDSFTRSGVIIVNDLCFGRSLGGERKRLLSGVGAKTACDGWLASM